MPYGAGNNALVTNAYPPAGDTVEEAINKLDAQFDTLYDQLNSDSATYLKKDQRGAVNGVAALDSGGKLPVSALPNNVLTKSDMSVANGIPTLGADGKIPISQIPLQTPKILTAEPDADDLAEGEVAYVVEA